ncbi:MAG: hypothetical protein IJT34_04145 [Butyrivibrio sp.]|nr:hypothetical protein [Butyrivibrio sp.]
MAAHFRSPGFCENRFRSLLLSGTLTMSVFYMMLLCDSIIAGVIIFILARPFCALFGITGGAALLPSIVAIRIVSLGLVFCSIVSILTSYYLLIDRVALATAITVLKDGILYSLLPLAGAGLAGQDGMWAAFTLAPLAALLISALWILLRYGRSRFPHLLAPSDTEIIVLDEHLTRERCGTLSERVQQELQLRNLPSRVVLRAAVFTEEIGLTVLEKNGTGRTSLLAEISLFFSANSLLIIERDSGMIFDITDVDQQVSGLSSFVLSNLMEVHWDKTHLTTTGYNRNIIRFELAAEQ